MIEKISTTKQIPLTRISRSRWQPRTLFDVDRLAELAKSIKENGLIHDVVVFPVQRDGQEWYELVAGERRVLAVTATVWAKLDKGIKELGALDALAKKGLDALPAKIRKAMNGAGSSISARIEPADDLPRLHRVAVVENIERESLSPLEEAHALKGLADENEWSQRELAKRIGKSQSYVAQRFQLLGLSEQAQDALSTRVLTPTHARAIAQVPEALQPAVTAWAAEAVQRDDSQATTRQVNSLSREITAFVTPDRWSVAEGDVVEPMERNRLALLRWGVENVDLTKHSADIMALSKHEQRYGPTRNLLGSKPATIVREVESYSAVLHALGLPEQKDDAWAAFAAATGRTCSDCIFGKAKRPAGLDDCDCDVHCNLWDHSVKIMTCEGFIGKGDPIVIPVRYYIIQHAKGMGIEIHKHGNDQYASSLEDYRRIIEAHVAAELERDRKVEAERARGHVDAITAFVDFQLEAMTNEAKQHFQAHTCAKCVHRDDHAGKPPCELAAKPLMQYSKPRPPQFAVIVSKSGEMYTRCEMFAYKVTPALATVPKVKFDRKRALAWLLALIGTNPRSGYMTKGALWGTLRWLAYDHSEKDDPGRLIKWIKREWDALGGDEAIATLFDAAIRERAAQQGYGRTAITLFNAVTGEEEEFAQVGFDVVTGKHRLYGKGWPKGFPKPWKKLEGAWKFKGGDADDDGDDGYCDDDDQDAGDEEDFND